MWVDNCSGESFHGHVGALPGALHFYNYTDMKCCLAGTSPIYYLSLKGLATGRGRVTQI